MNKELFNLERHLVYVASPYSHDEQSVREYRFQEVGKYVAHLFRQGSMPFSPVLHSHPIAQLGLPGDWFFWRDYDTKFIPICKACHVLMLPGWNTSRGVTEEIRLFTRHHRQIIYVRQRPLYDVEVLGGFHPSTGAALVGGVVSAAPST